MLTGALRGRLRNGVSDFLIDAVDGCRQFGNPNSICTLSSVELKQPSGWLLGACVALHPDRYFNPHIGGLLPVRVMLAK